MQIVVRKRESSAREQRGTHFGTRLLVPRRTASSEFEALPITAQASANTTALLQALSWHFQCHRLEESSLPHRTVRPTDVTLHSNPPLSRYVALRSYSERPALALRRVQAFLHQWPAPPAMQLQDMDGGRPSPPSLGRGPRQAIGPRPDAVRQRQAIEQDRHEGRAAARPREDRAQPGAGF